MTDELTLEQIDRIIANHENGVQLTDVNVYRQLAAAMRERDALAETLRWYSDPGNYDKAGVPSSRVFCMEANSDLDELDLGERAEKALAKQASGELRN